MSEFRVYVEDRMAFGDEVLLYLLERVGKQTYLHTHDRQRLALADGAAPDAGTEFARLPREAEVALLAALQARVGIADPSLLRQDYVHVRDRHDKLVDHLMERRK